MTNQYDRNRTVQIIEANSFQFAYFSCLGTHMSHSCFPCHRQRNAFSALVIKLKRFMGGLSKDNKILQIDYGQASWYKSSMEHEGH